jgi:HEAT repeat protein
MPADVSHWIANLSSPDIVLKAKAAEALAKLGEAAQAAAVPLVQASASAEESVREWVVAALEDIGPPAASDLAQLQALVAAEHADVSYWAITLLGRLEASGSPAVPTLIDALKHNPHPHNRQRAAWALGKIGPTAKEALPALHEAAHGTDSRLARISLLSIEEISNGQ